MAWGEEQPMSSWSAEKLLDVAARSRELFEQQQGRAEALVRECAQGAARQGMDAQACADWMAGLGVRELQYVGPFGRHGMSVGDKVLVRAGARVYSTKGSVPKLGVVSLRAKTVTVSKITEGWVKWDNGTAVVCNPLITWAGKGGYWCWCDMNNAERVGRY